MIPMPDGNESLNLAMWATTKGHTKVTEAIAAREASTVAETKADVAQEKDADSPRQEGDGAEETVKANENNDANAPETPPADEAATAEGADDEAQKGESTEEAEPKEGEAAGEAPTDDPPKEAQPDDPPAEGAPPDDPPPDDSPPDNPPAEDPPAEDPPAAEGDSPASDDAKEGKEGEGTGEG